MRHTAIAVLVMAGLMPAIGVARDGIVIGGKIFTESYVLGEMAAQTIEADSSVPVTRKLGMGSTGILFEALKSGAIDVYPDYTGTLAEAILKKPELKSLEDIRGSLAAMGLTISGSLGFNDTYALAVKEEFAEKHNLHSIGDLIPIESQVRAGFSYEFMDRKDGYPGLIDSYHLGFVAAECQPHGAFLELPGDRSERGGSDRCVFDGCEDQEAQPAPAQGRSQLFSGVPGRVGGANLLRAAASARVAGVADPRRPHL